MAPALVLNSARKDSILQRRGEVPLLLPPHFNRAGHLPSHVVFRIAPVDPVHTPRRSVAFGDVVASLLGGPPEQHEHNNHHEHKLCQAVVEQPADEVQNVFQLK